MSVEKRFNMKVVLNDVEKGERELEFKNQTSEEITSLLSAWLEDFSRIVIEEESE